MVNESINLDELLSLSDSDRLDARDEARDIVTRAIGDKPTREQFADHHLSKFPAWFQRVIGLGLLLIFLAAANLSIFRVFTAGRDHFLETINDPAQAAIAGIATFALAEILVIVSVVSMQVYFKGRERYMMLVPIILGLAMAFVGNWVIAQPHDLFGYLESILPPTAVLFVGIIAERVVIQGIKRRHANEIAYQEALNGWKVATADPETSPRWKSAYANALKAKLIDINSKGTGSTRRKEVLSTLGVVQWRYLVGREMSADNWFTGDPSADVIQTGVTLSTNGQQSGHVPPSLPVPTVATNGNGHHHNGHGRH